MTRYSLMILLALPLFMSVACQSSSPPIDTKRHAVAAGGTPATATSDTRHSFSGELAPMRHSGWFEKPSIGKRKLALCTYGSSRVSGIVTGFSAVAAQRDATSSKPTTGAPLLYVS